MTHDCTMVANPVSFASVREVAESLTPGAAETAELASCVHQHARLLFKVAYGVLRNSPGAPGSRPCVGR